MTPESNVPGIEVQQLQDLLEGFGAAYAFAAPPGAGDARKALASFPPLLEGFDATIEQWKEDQRATADDFNLLEVMQLTKKEIRHSMILAWMLDHDLTRLGTHAQGDIGFRLFVTEVGLPADYAAGRPYRVRREVPSDESRMDIEIAERGRFLIHIENKIGSGLGHRQLERQWSDLEKRARTMGVPTSSAHLLFLTPDGRKPDDPHGHGFMAVSWRKIAKVLVQFASEARPPDVKLFALHYAKVLKKHVIQDPDGKEIDNG